MNFKTSMLRLLRPAPISLKFSPALAHRQLPLCAAMRPQHHRESVEAMIADNAAGVHREAEAYSEEEALRLGREAGEQLKAEAGPEFMTWSH